MHINKRKITNGSFTPFMRKAWNYEELIFIVYEGKMYNTQDDNINLDEAQYLRDVIVNCKDAVASAQNIGGKESILFTIPVEGYNLLSFLESQSRSPADEFAVMRKDIMDGKNGYVISSMNGVQQYIIYQSRDNFEFTSHTYALVYTNIEKLHLINQQYDREVGVHRHCLRLL